MFMFKTGKRECEWSRCNQPVQQGRGSLSDRWSLWHDSIRAYRALELQRSYCGRSRQHSSPSHSHLHTWITLAPFQNPVSILTCTVDTKPVLKVSFKFLLPCLNQIVKKHHMYILWDWQIAQHKENTRWSTWWYKFWLYITVYTTVQKVCMYLFILI